VGHNVKLDDLLKGNADVPNDQQVEAEFEIFQAGDKNAQKFANLVVNKGDAVLVLRYEFYKYIGDFTAQGEALCGGNAGGKGGGGGGGITPDACGGLGDFVGAQMAGFNVVQPPVPEPGTTAMMLAGLGVMGLLVRVRRA
jgi:hypothetical protein